MKVYRYYTRLRPPMPGAIPLNGVTNTATFDWKQSFNGVGCWGWAEYDHELTQKEIDDYELAPSVNNPLVYD